jgi:hypothetical protein
MSLPHTWVYECQKKSKVGLGLGGVVDRACHRNDALHNIFHSSEGATGPIFVVEKCCARVKRKRAGLLRSSEASAASSAFTLDELIEKPALRLLQHSAPPRHNGPSTPPSTRPSLPSTPPRCLLGSNITCKHISSSVTSKSKASGWWGLGAPWRDL